MSRSVRSLNPESLVNLVRNGGLDFGTEYWTFTGYTPTLTTGTQTEAHGASRYLNYQLKNDTAAVLTQGFRSSASFDFPVPTASLDRPDLASGYVSQFDCLLGKGRSFSIGVSVQVSSGSCSIKASFLDRNYNVLSEQTLDNNQDSFFTGRAWVRLTKVLTTTDTPSYIRLTIQRTKAELCEVNVAKIQLSQGAYDMAPYTGDLTSKLFPEGTVIMVMGASCPPGFTALESSTADDEVWRENNIETRKGAFPTGADVYDETELVGSPTHNRDEYVFELDRDDILLFESFDSTFGQSTSTTGVGHNSKAKSPADVPGEDETADHQHTVLEGGSIPVNRQFRFCRRVT